MQQGVRGVSRLLKQENRVAHLGSSGGRSISFHERLDCLLRISLIWRQLWIKMHRMSLLKTPRVVVVRPRVSRMYSTGAVPLKARHLLSIADLSVPELQAVLARSAELKQSVKTSGLLPGMTTFTPGPLAGQSVGMIFSKRSTRTRVSTESAVALLGGHPMFLGKDDIQLGVRLVISINPLQ